MKKEKYINILIKLSIILGAIIVIRVFFIFLEVDDHVEMYDDLQEQLGFKYNTPYLEEGGEALIISEVTEGGLMEKAGFRKGDRYGDIDSSLVIDFTNTFIFNQESTVEVPIIRDGEHTNIQIYVPKLQFDVDPHTLHYPFFKYKK